MQWRGRGRVARQFSSVGSPGWKSYVAGGAEEELLEFQLGWLWWVWIEVV